MTARPAPVRRRPPRPSTKSVTAKVAALAAAGTLAIAGGLSWQMSQGGDPALGAQAATADRPQTGRRIVKTVVIRKVQAPASSPSYSAPATAASSAPAVSAPAPVTSSTS